MKSAGSGGREGPVRCDVDVLHRKKCPDLAMIQTVKDMALKA